MLLLVVLCVEIDSLVLESYTVWHGFQCRWHVPWVSLTVAYFFLSFSPKKTSVSAMFHQWPFKPSLEFVSVSHITTCATCLISWKLFVVGGSVTIKWKGKQKLHLLFLLNCLLIFLREWKKQSVRSPSSLFFFFYWTSTFPIGRSECWQWWTIKSPMGKYCLSNFSLKQKTSWAPAVITMQTLRNLFFTDFC